MAGCGQETWRFVTELPKTNNGKIDKRLLQQWDAQDLNKVTESPA